MWKRSLFQGRTRKDKGNDDDDIGKSPGIRYCDTLFDAKDFLATDLPLHLQVGSDLRFCASNRDREMKGPLGMP